MSGFYRSVDALGLLFPVIWAVLYLLMPLAAARVAGQPGNGLALGLWAQIIISTLWSATFFGLHRIRLSQHLQRFVIEAREDNNASAA